MEDVVFVHEECSRSDGKVFGVKHYFCSEECRSNADTSDNGYFEFPNCDLLDSTTFADKIESGSSCQTCGKPLEPERVKAIRERARRESEEYKRSLEARGLPPIGPTT